MRIAAGPPGSANAKLVDVLSNQLQQSHVRLHLQPGFYERRRGRSAQAVIKNAPPILRSMPTPRSGNSPDWPVVAILRQNKWSR